MPPKKRTTKKPKKKAQPRKRNTTVQKKHDGINIKIDMSRKSNNNATRQKQQREPSRAISTVHVSQPLSSHIPPSNDQLYQKVDSIQDAVKKLHDLKTSTSAPTASSSHPLSGPKTPHPLAKTPYAPLKQNAENRFGILHDGYDSDTVLMPQNLKKSHKEFKKPILSKYNPETQAFQDKHYCEYCKQSYGKDFAKHLSTQKHKRNVKRAKKHNDDFGDDF